MLKVHHFKEIPSTQVYLKDNLANLLKDFQDYDAHLVVAENQTSGIGRSGNSWVHLTNAVAFSFNLPPHPSSMTLTTLELGILVVQFLEQKFKVKTYLKWPNDIMNSKGEKCGGIIVNYHDVNNLICGIGLNFSLNHSNEDESLKSFRIKGGTVFNTNEENLLPSNFKKIIPINFFEFCEDSRIKDQNDLTANWNSNCYHIEKAVSIDDGIKTTKGIFKGIGPEGEALIDDGKKIATVISGTLSF